MSHPKKGSKEAKDRMAAMRAMRGTSKTKKATKTRRAMRKASKVSTVLGGEYRRKPGKAARGAALVRKISAKKRAAKSSAADSAATAQLLSIVARASKPANRTKKSRGRAYGQVMPNAADEAALLKALGLKSKPSGTNVLWACGGRVRTGCGKGRVMDRVYK